MKQSNAARAVYTVPSIYGTSIPSRHAVETTRPAVYTTAEVAAVLRVGTTTTKALIKSGDLPSIMVRRRRLVRVDAIDAFLAARERGGRKHR
jgi:excisionase family DNA binding protein